ncbi:conserved hypothetical protein [Uncinocarpus reesii 1704]|uniref:Protein kinase domain-containing protein n=1 Tax=Uncinocarpus reesii (strain UAMH 1704) TaxID=336963 RepID=C4JZU5_UNCRE|nr:uncharacterized protein UREG_07696 [Uncinocarpus reesii 1704]EEP82831.1 conserved hypothetical protein [Uncinocarpus reesii 1704]
MTLDTSPTPLPAGQRRTAYNPQLTSIHDLHRRTVSRHMVSHGSPNGVPVESGTRSEDMARPRAFSAGDSSDDDDFPEPIKFSAAAKALLEEGVSGLDTSPRRSPRGVIEGEGYQTDQVRRQQGKHVRIASPGQRMSASPSLRIVRLASESRRSPSSLGKESSFMSNRGEGGYDGSMGTGNDFVTPAPRTRSVRIATGSRSTTRSTSASILSANGGSSSDASRIDERSLLEEGVKTGLDERSCVRSGMGTVPRVRGEVDTGVHGSLRVKRVGKLPGSFLNGPARRGVPRRQSEEETHPEYQEESYLNPEPHARYGEGQVPISRLGDSMLRGDAPFERRRESPRLSDHNMVGSASAMTPRSIPIRERSHQKENGSSALKNGSPLPLNHLKSSSGSRHSGSPKSFTDSQPEYRAPRPVELPAKNDQENGAPSTFKTSRPHGFGSLNDKVSVLYEGNKSSNSKPPPETVSPRKPLGKMSNNTPRRPAPLPPPKMSVLETATAVAGAATSKKKRAQVSVNRKTYTRMDCIGRGGSSRVYRVMAENCKIFALKRVNLEDVDPSALIGYKGEIDLLKKLRNVERVVQLYDWEINEEKRALSVLMEMGESDLHEILKFKLNAEDAAFDPVLTRFYWKEMLECVQAVHDFDIVHSDLKPANFLLVRGKLKLIDFGIANTIQDHTVNVHREQQTGTPNYMAPEALIDCNAMSGLPATAGKMMKLGKPSDVWSLGCILYLMVYGKPPFAHITKLLERIMSIPNPKVPINYPPVGVGNIPVPPSILRTLKGCLQRDQTLRPTIKQLLGRNDPFLYPEAHLQGTVPISQEMLGRILSNVVNHCRARGTPTDEELAGWPSGFFAKIQAAMQADG